MEENLPTALTDLQAVTASEALMFRIAFRWRLLGCRGCGYLQRWSRTWVNYNTHATGWGKVAGRELGLGDTNLDK
jgi:hypothetical protein